MSPVCFQYAKKKAKHGMALDKLSKTQENSFLKSRNKVMLVTFFDSQGIIHKQFVPPGQAVNNEYYVEALSLLVQRIGRGRPQFQDRESWFLLHDNARPHNAVSVQRFVGKTRDYRTESPPYSNDLSPPDFFLFPRDISTLRSRRFEDTEGIKKNVAKELLALHANEFKKCFQQFYKREQKCATSQGHYFEEH
jgi:hypothetical protein